jgi:hypothetical protein
MDIRYKFFPYPVLSSFSDDYINCKFITDIKAVRDIKDIVFYLNVFMNNTELQTLISTNKIEYVFHIECSQTSYRAIVSTADLENIKRIPENKLNGKVTICSFIVAKENLKSYTNNMFNSDYGNLVFNIEKGSILAIGGQTNVEIVKETEELSKIPSIFSIIRLDTDENAGMKFELGRDKITIQLANETFYKYKNSISMPIFQPVLHSMIIMPALIYVFETLKNAGIEEYEAYRWFKAIERILKKSNIELNSSTLDNKPSYELAQRLLDLPVDRALKSLLNVGTEDEEE